MNKKDFKNQPIFLEVSRCLLTFPYKKPNFKAFFSFLRIIAMCGDYYIGGRQFESLSDLIGYYSSYSCLLKNEQLRYPVPPTEVRKEKTFKIFNYPIYLSLKF